MRTIVLATDGSASSEQALRFASELAGEARSTLEVVAVRAATVWRFDPARPAREPADDWPEQAVRHAAAVARDAGVVARTRVLEGDVVAAIIDTVTAVQADLLVVGARGRGPVSAAMLGSVAQALVRRSPVPVTVIRYALPSAA